MRSSSWGVPDERYRRTHVWPAAGEDGTWGLLTWLHRRGADPDLGDERAWVHVGVRAPGYRNEYRRVLLLDPQAPADVDLEPPDALPSPADDVAQIVGISLRRVAGS